MTGLVLCVLVSGVFPALASGLMPPLESEKQSFPSFEACRARLEEMHRADLTKADAQPLPVEGGTQQTLISTAGVVAQDDKAVYDVVETWRARRPRPEFRQIMSQDSYVIRHWICEGRQLSGTSQQGYTLESYEPMTTDSPTR